MSKIAIKWPCFSKYGTNVNKEIFRKFWETKNNDTFWKTGLDHSSQEKIEILRKPIE